MDNIKNNQSSLVGQRAEFEVLVTEEMIQKFSQLSGDCNPLHLSSSHAIKLGYSSNVVHGMLLASFVSRLVGEHLPGGDVLLLSVKLNFHKSIHPQSLITVFGEILTESSSTQTMEIKFGLQKAKELICTGTALVQKLLKGN